LDDVHIEPFYIKIFWITRCRGSAGRGARTERRTRRKPGTSSTEPPRGGAACCCQIGLINSF